MSNGIRTTNLELSFVIDELLGNVTADGVERTARLPFEALANQLAGTGPFVFGNTFYAFTKAQLDAYVPPNERMGGVVLNDPNAANNGYYARSGGAWMRGRGFPDTFAKLTVIGGTANAIQAAPSPGVDPSVVLVFYFTPTQSNTGATTLSVAGGPPLPVRDIAGAALSAGDLVAGRKVMLVPEPGGYGLLSDPSGYDVVQAASDFADAAAASAIEAEADRLAAEAAAAAISGIEATSVQGRLSLTSGLALSASDVVGATAIYYVPSSGRYAPIYDGTRYVSRSIGSQISLPLNPNTGHAGYQAAGKNYDLFLIYDAGTIRLGTGPAWNDGAVAGSDILRGTGAGSTELETFNGTLVNKNPIAVRFGASSGDTVAVPARRATYVGSFRATANGQATDSKAKRLLFNAYNQAMRPVFVSDPAANWTYSTAAWRIANGSTSNRIEVLFGLQGVGISVRCQSLTTVTGATLRSMRAAIGLDSVSAPAANSLALLAFAYAGLLAAIPASYDGVPGLGFHYLAWLEWANPGSETTTWYGTDTAGGNFQTGLSGWVLN